jgi:catechol 2,3-dioxygenase-like lactoylglutathione lyase family enzyme
MKRSFFAFAVLLGCLAASASHPLMRPRIYILGSVRFRVLDLKKSRDFYQKTFQIGAVRQDCFGVNTLCLEINSAQRIELIQRENSLGRDLVEQVGFRTYNLDGLRRYLIQRGVKPGEITKDKNGNPSFSVLDAEGHGVVFLPPPLPGSYFSWPGQVSRDIIHVGFVVHNRAAMDRFYKDILGFHLYWQGGRKDDETSWVNMQVPDGTDWIEYMLNVPDNADHHTLGVMNHIALGVSDIKATQEQLIKNGWKAGEEPKIGRGGKWQLNVYDPDETRVEFMEFTPVQKPCCSDYTGSHPGSKQ